MSDLVIKYRKLIVVSSIVLTILAALMIPRLEISPGLEQYVPEHLEHTEYLKELNEIFGSSEIILVMMRAKDVVNAQSLHRLRELAADLQGL